MDNKKENMVGIQTINFAESRVPKIVEKGNKEYLYFGEDNQYPQYLLDLFYKSSKNASMLSSISDMITGENFVTEGKSESLLRFLENENNKESLYEILPKISFDLCLFGAFTLNVIWSKDGKSIAQIKYLPVQKIRFEKENYEEEQEFEYFYVSRDWDNIRKTENKPIRVAGFNPRNQKEKSQILYVKKYRPGLEYYGLPHYISAVNWIELDNEISNYHLQNTKNGYMVGLVMNFATGIPTVEEQKKVKRQLDENFQGTNNAGKVVLTFSEGQDQATTITPIELNTSDQRFKDLESQIVQNILIANKATTPMIFGVKTEGQLGGRNEILEAFEIYQNTVIGSFQDVITTSLQNLAEINGISDEIEIQEYEIFKKIEEQKEVIEDNNENNEE